MLYKLEGWGAKALLFCRQGAVLWACRTDDQVVPFGEGVPVLSKPYWRGMVAAGDASKGIYDHLYRRFFENREEHKGYDFQHAPGGSAQTPVVTFREKLRWWTLDRWRRRKQILSERDRLQREILDIRKRSA